jgi:predicted NAD/FAD-binding protein
MSSLASDADIAVVGSGIAGLSAAWALSQRHRVTVYEAQDRLGGHTNTVSVPTPGGLLGIDTGFIVYNEKTYPNLTALFRHLGIATQPSDMSFAVSKDNGRFEYSGGTLGGLFAQPSNLLRARFWSMLRDLMRFYREAPADLALAEAEGLSLGRYLDTRRYGSAFRHDHLLPMASAIWSTPVEQIADYPAAGFLRFCTNHGLLQIRDRPLWRTVTGGSSTYLYHLMAGISGRVFKQRPIRRITRHADYVVLTDADGTAISHDHVVIATHAPQALRMLEDADAGERDRLGAFGSTANAAVLHTDRSFMPRRRAAWSAWNFVDAPEAEGAQPYLTYWMNRLQALPGAEDYFVTINPPRMPKDGTCLHCEDYAHPLFDARSLQAQRRLWDLQGRRRTWFCGAWFGAGFHEDALQAGLAVAEALGGVRRPWTVPDESGRIFLPAACRDDARAPVTA